MTSFFNSFILWFRRKKFKPLFLVDGDSCIKDTWVYLDVLGSSEVYVVHNALGSNKPKLLSKLPEVNYLPFNEFRSSKESTDKIIAILAQKAIDAGYTDINLVSKDGDFADIAKMLAGVNTNIGHLVNINVLLPEVRDRAKYVDYTPSVHGNIFVRVYWIKRKQLQ